MYNLVSGEHCSQGEAAAATEGCPQSASGYCAGKNGIFVSSQTGWEQSYMYTVSNFHSSWESPRYISNIIAFLEPLTTSSISALILIASEVNSASLFRVIDSCLFPVLCNSIVRIPERKTRPPITSQCLFLTVFLVHVNKNYKAL